MKQVFISLSMISVLLIVGCDRLTDYIPETILIEKTIGIAGGEIEEEGLTISVPAGALSQDTKIAIYEAAGKGPYAGEQLTGRYKITGLPRTSKQPITISLEHAGIDDGEPFISLGEEVLVPGAAETVMSYELLPAINDGSSLQVILPGYQSQPTGTAKASTGGFYDQIPRESVVVQGDNKIVWLSSQGNFKIVWPITQRQPPYLQEVGDALEEAYVMFQSIGFNYDERTDWPFLVDVIYNAPQEDWSAWFQPSNDGINYGTIAYNYESFNSTSLIRSTLGHEFMHFVQSLYNPGSDDRATRLATLTLGEATGVWAETLFNPAPPEILSYRPGAPFNGFQIEPEFSEQLAIHTGYSFGSLFMYLTQKYGGPSVVYNTWNQVKNGAHPITAFIGASESPVAWLHDYYRSLLTDYDRYQLNYAQNNTAQQVNLGPNRPEFSHTKDYADLSGQLYLFDFDLGIDANSSIQFSLPDGDPLYDNLSLFQTQHGSVPEFINFSDTKIILPGAEDYAGNNIDILVLVTHAKAKEPYKTITPLTLHAKLVEGAVSGLAFSLAYVNMEYNEYNAQGEVIAESVAGDFGAKTPNFYLGNDQYYQPHFEANLEALDPEFVQTWDYTNAEGIHYMGSLSVAVDRSFEEVKGYEFKSTESGGQPEGQIKVTEVYHYFAAIPRAPIDVKNASFIAEGDEVCKQITTIKSSRTDSQDNLRYEVIKHSCWNLSQLKITLIR